MFSQSEQESEPTTRHSRTRVVIVGAGPIGLEMAVECTRRGIAFEIVEAGAIGQTISWWAPQTRWFSSNERIAIAGVPLLTKDQSKATREEYLTYLRGVVQQFGFPVHCYQRVVEIRRREVGFTVVSQSHGEGMEIDCEAVVLAVGGLDRPQYLGIEGEDLPHVDSYFREPHRYYGRKVLIIGGRNSAAEAALRLHHAGANVSLSYRGTDLPEDHIKYWLLPEIRGLIRTGRITAYFGTRPVRMTPTHVELESSDGSRQFVAADEVLSLIGYVQDKSLFRQVGIDLVGDSQKPKVNETTLETNVPGIYIAGTAIAGSQRSDYKVFLENCHQHIGKILTHLTGTEVQSESPAFQQHIQSAPES